MWSDSMTKSSKHPLPVAKHRDPIARADMYDTGKMVVDVGYP